MYEAFQTICQRLDEAQVDYRVIAHPPEGRTEEVSAIRGHPITQAAKCIMLIVKSGKRSTRFVLAVVRGDSRVDMARVKSLFNATYAGFAAADVAERLAQSEVGTVLPFAMDDGVLVIADPALLAEERLYFNAARLDRSITMTSQDYLRFQKPRVESISVHAS